MSTLEEVPAHAGPFDMADGGLPVAHYGELTVARLLPLLTELTATELRRVRDYERRHANRTPVLEAIERLIG